jgi:hypothetical protein
MRQIYYVNSGEADFINLKRGEGGFYSFDHRRGRFLLFYKR